VAAPAPAGGVNCATVATLDRLVDEVCARAVGVPGDVVSVVTGAVDRLAPLSSLEDRNAVIGRAVARLDGLDGLEHVLSDADVDEVMVNRGREVWVDRRGALHRLHDLHPGAVEVVLERVLAPLGKRLDRTNPIIDARLPDGSRLCAVVSPVALDGTTMSIRRHRHRRVPVGEFAPPQVVAVLRAVVEQRANVLVTGATSSGKTTLLAAMTDFAADGERLVLIEDTSELVLADHHHVVRLEARAAGLDGVDEIDLARLVRTALRLRPDRLIVGEFRGREVVAVVEALNTGHDGSLSTCHANSAIDGLRRIETLVMQAAPSWPLAAIRRQVSRSIDIVVHLVRDADGKRTIDEVIEVVETEREPAGRPLVTDGREVAELTRGRR
jgi:pilus assembly protein CpaF